MEARSRDDPAVERPAERMPPEDTRFLAMRSRGAGEDLLLFHGGMGSWRHWVRNIDALAERFRVHALDLPGYGDSAPVPRDITAEAYFGLVHRAIQARFPRRRALRVAGFSFGAVVASAVVRQLGDQVRSFTLIGPSGFGAPREERKLPTASYRRAGDDRARLREAMRQNLLAVMLLHRASVDDEVLALQDANVRLHKGMNSRKVSVLDVVPENLRAIRCPVQLIFGDSDQVARGGLAERVERCRQARPDIEVHILPDTGHWAMFEGAPAVNAALLAFHRRG